MIKAEVDYTRVIHEGFCELADTTIFVARTKTDLMRQIRLKKKEIAKKCKYKITGDTIRYTIYALQEVE